MLVRILRLHFQHINYVENMLFNQVIQSREILRYQIFISKNKNNVIDFLSFNIFILDSLLSYTFLFQQTWKIHMRSINTLK